MADTVDTKVIRNSKGHYTVTIQNRSDGTGESDVTKVDISTLLNSAGAAATYTSIERIDYAVWGFNYVLLEWDHTTDDEIATLAGVGSIDWTYEGGNKDPQSSGGTGDILLTTSGTTANSGYNITIRLKLK
jgi:hypothetical protein